MLESGLRLFHVLERGKNMRNIVKNKTKYTPNLIFELKSATEIPKKYKILRYLKSVKPSVYGVFALKDVINGEVYSTSCRNYDENGWEWTDADIYYFEKYNIPLDEEFVTQFN